jgi:hypothetical protein
MEVAHLRENNEALLLETTSLKLERNARKKKESNAKRSVLRSFQWREDKVDASVLRGAVAFWGATSELADDADEEKKRMSNRARKNILKVIVEQGFSGELHDDMDLMKTQLLKTYSKSSAIWPQSSLTIGPHPTSQKLQSSPAELRTGTPGISSLEPISKQRDG